MALRKLKTSANPSFEEVRKLLREGETLLITALTQQFSNDRECRAKSEWWFNSFVNDRQLRCFEFYGESN